MKYIAVVGSRGFNDYDKFIDKINHYTKRFKRGEITFVSGGASSGADFLIEKFCREHNLPIIVYKADWNKYGKSAGFRRNIDIVAKSDFVIAFWDGESRGAKHSIDLTNIAEKPLRIVKV